MTKPKPVECTEIVYRAILKKSFIDKETEEVSIEAYFLRPDDQGLSVSLASKCSVEHVVSSFNKCFGVATLHVGHVKALGLEVLHAPPPDEHALIVNVPHLTNDRTEAERFAGLLARQSRVIPHN